jgi:DNA-binding transcriptional LysR family regulator
MPELADMRLFVHAVQAGSLSAAGRELGFSPAVGSKRLSRLETELGVLLLQRSSRRLVLTEEGSIYFERCRTLLAEVEEAGAAVAQGRSALQGVLRVSSTIALGRRWVGPVLAQMAAEHPGLSVQLSLSDSVVDLIEGSFDCAVRIGGATDSRLLARPLAANRRVLCAAPAYLERCGRPSSLEDLKRHNCIIMTRASALHADWTFRPTDSPEAALSVVRVQGRLVTDNGEQAHDWALAGLGLVRRSYWDVEPDLAAGRLVEVMDAWTSESAPIQAVFPSRRFLPARTRTLIDRLVAQFARER